MDSYKAQTVKARPQNWGCWSDAEQVAWDCLQDEWDTLRMFEARLEAKYGRDLRRELDELTTTAQTIGAARIELIEARLQRYRPDLADLIAWACRFEHELLPGEGAPA